VNALLNKVGSGSIHISTAIDIAQSVRDDGFNHPTVTTLASLGGIKRKNDERDFHVWLKDLHCHHLELYTLWFDLHSESDGRTIPTPIPAVPIWQMCHALFRAGPLQFRVSLLGRHGEPSVLSFWQNALRLPWGQRHPAVAPHSSDSGYLKTLIPLYIHLDGAEIYTNSEFYVLSFSSALATDCSVLDAKFPILQIPHAAIRDKEIKKQAMRVMAAFVAWNFQVLQDGRGPKVGFYGEPLDGVRAALIDQDLMGPYKACCSGCKADLKARREAHFFAQNYNTSRVCERCHATQPFKNVMRSPALKRLLYTDLSADAPWRGTRISHEQYVAAISDPSEVSPWFVIPGMRLEMVFFDLMHVGPLGIFRNLCAAVVTDFVERGELRNINDGLSLRQLWLEFTGWCRARRIPPPRGTLSLRVLGRSLGKKDPPELHSSIKATTVKLLVGFLAQKCCELVIAGDLHTQTRSACLWSASEFLWVCDHAGVVLTCAQIARLEYCGRMFTLSFASLCDLTTGRNLLQPRPKLHYFEELVIQTVEMRLNPKYIACWGEESLLGRIKRLGQKCHGRSMLTTVMLRYFVHLAMRWEERRKTRRWYIGG
jgi:hypothetical protein